MRRFIVFALAEGNLAFNVGYALEVIRRRPVKQVPEMPEYIEGFVKMRDDLLPVINMRRRLGVPDFEKQVNGRLLILRSSIGKLALAVDDVLGIETVSREMIRRPPVVFKGIKKKYIEGLYPRTDDMCIILDIEKILSSDEKILIQKARKSLQVTGT